MSRRRDREKRETRLETYDGLKPEAPGSPHHCSHPPATYAAAGWKCPEFDQLGCCFAIPF